MCPLLWPSLPCCLYCPMLEWWRLTGSFCCSIPSLSGIVPAFEGTVSCQFPQSVCMKHHDPVDSGGGCRGGSHWGLLLSLGSSGTIIQVQVSFKQSRLFCLELAPQSRMEPHHHRFGPVTIGLLLVHWLRWLDQVDQLVLELHWMAPPLLQSSVQLILISLGPGCRTLKPHWQHGHHIGWERRSWMSCRSRAYSRTIRADSWTILQAPATSPSKCMSTDSASVSWEICVASLLRNCKDTSRLGQISNNVPGKSPAGIFEGKEANHFF